MEDEDRLGLAGDHPVPALRFARLMRQVSRKHKSQVIILIDE